MTSLQVWTPDGTSDVPRLVETLARLRATGGRVITTNGCFDLLHRGHVHYLQAARALGSTLVVGLNSDRSVRALKGPARPLVAAADRAAVLGGLSCVDHVVIFDDLTPVEFLRVVRPDLHCKGGDYDAESLPERDVVRQGGGRIRILPLLPGYSTTAIARRLGDAEADVDPSVDRIRGEFRRAADTLLATARDVTGATRDAATQMVSALRAGGTVLACGNGGSASDGHHFVAEMVGRFRRVRGGFRALALSADPAVVTAIANDFGYESLFARQVEAFGRPGDVLLALTTSGRSPNVLRAAEAARACGLSVVAVTGAAPTPLSTMAHVHVRVPSTSVEEIQTATGVVLHVLAGIVEEALTTDRVQSSESA